MGKIEKYANLYDKDGNLIKHVNDFGLLEDVRIKELEELVDSLDKDSEQYKNAFEFLQIMYQNPKTDEDKEYVESLRKDLISRLNEYAKNNTTEEQVNTALEEVDAVIENNNQDEVDAIVDSEPTYNVNTSEAEYVDYEEVAEAA